MLASFSLLHQMGLHLLWLDGKAPVDANGNFARAWTTAPRQTYQQWLNVRPPVAKNVGVALGHQSKLGDGTYLACLDFDFKDATPEEVKDVMRLACKMLGPSVIASAPRVKSGQGYHLYFKTAEPFKSKTLVKSPRQILNPNGSKSNAWELAAYSSGRQMVLPPSIHPLTGARYSWIIAPTDTSSFPLVAATALTSGATGALLEHGGAPVAVSSAAPVDPAAKLDDFKHKISSHYYYAIRTLNKVTDRSAMLYQAAKALHGAGATQAQINGILLSPENAISQTAYDHAKTDDYHRALAWQDRYNVKPAIEAYNKEQHFAAVAKPIPPPGAGIGKQTDAAYEATQAAIQMGFHATGPNNQPIPDHGALASYFEEVKGVLLTIADENEIFHWAEGKYYKRISDLEIKYFAQQNFNPAPSEQTRMEFVARVRMQNVTTRETVELSALNKIAFNNGVLDTRHKVLIHHNPKHFIRGYIPYDYDPEALCPRFAEWIQEVMCKDLDLISVLQEFMGYVVEGGAYTHHKMLWLSGSGRNGKSTFIDVLKALVGRENYISASLSSLMSDKFMASMLDGKLLCASEEVNFGDYRDSGLIKTLTGDGEITAQRKFKPAFDFRNKAKMVQSLNELPQLTDLSPGMISRIIIVPFNRTFSDAEQDKGIKEKLMAELPGIFNWALAGLERLHKNGKFTEPKAGAEALEGVQHDSSSVAQWADSYLVPADDKAFVTANEMYLHYRKVLPHPVGIARFARELGKIKRLKELKGNNSGKRGYRGVKLDLGFT